MRSQYGVEISIYEVDRQNTTKRLGVFKYSLPVTYSEAITDLHFGCGLNLFWLGLSAGIIKFDVRRFE